MDVEGFSRLTHGDLLAKGNGGNYLRSFWCAVLFAPLSGFSALGFVGCRDMFDSTEEPWQKHSISI
jgi:hypothetical protein